MTFLRIVSFLKFDATKKNLSKSRIRIKFKINGRLLQTAIPLHSLPNFKHHITVETHTVHKDCTSGYY